MIFHRNYTYVLFLKVTNSKNRKLQYETNISKYERNTLMYPLFVFKVVIKR